MSKKRGYTIRTRLTVTRRKKIVKCFFIYRVRVKFNISSTERLRVTGTF